jgi:hypothetical protein
VEVVLFSSPELIVVIIGTAIFLGSTVLFGQRLLSILRSNWDSEDETIRSYVFSYALLTLVSISILIILWLKTLRNYFGIFLFLSLVVSFVLTRTAIESKQDKK